MLRILRDRFLRLGRDDDGVALVTTLAVFMFMYLVCIGVYAIGTAVKTRIHLQNACDAAAYSAAVVQADTLSRIATLNRAMSWTYVQMTRRQMDGIVYKLMDTTWRNYRDDYNKAKRIHGGSGSGCPLGHHDGPYRLKAAKGWYIGADSSESHVERVKVNGGSDYPLYTFVEEKCEYFNGNYMDVNTNIKNSFFDFQNEVINFDVLYSQVRSDKETIRAINDKIKSLADALYENETRVVQEVINSNLPNEIYNQLHVTFDVCKTPLAFDGFLDYLGSSNDEESRFFWFGGYYGNKYQKVCKNGNIAKSSMKEVFDNGCDTWFSHENRNGFLRKYRQLHDLLSTEWEWKAAYWNCYEDSDGVWHHPPYSYTHGENALENRIEGIDFKSKYPELYEGVESRPMIVKPDYFKKPGSITVGLACYNDNPWQSLLGVISKGIFSAFNPFVKWTVCFSSAKAGYKYIGEDEDNEKRAYRIDWRGSEDKWDEPEQSWNLCQSDWDAVLIPVRRAEAFASGRSWDDGVTDLSNYVENGLNIGADEMLAGGDGLDLGEFYRNRDFGEEYRFGNRNGFWGGVKPPLSYRTTAQWRIGNPHGRLDWENIQRVMFH